MGDKTITAALAEEGGQQIFNDYVLRRLRESEAHAEEVTQRLDELERVQAPIREVFGELKRIFIKITATLLAFLLLTQAAGLIDISSLLG